MEHWDHTVNPPVLIDLRQTLYVALRAVCIAYLNNEISLDVLHSFQVEVGWNTHKMREAYGHHPFFDLDGEIDGSLAVMRDHDLGEIHFKDRMREHLNYYGPVLLNPTGTTGTTNIIQATFKAA